MDEQQQEEESEMDCDETSQQQPTQQSTTRTSISTTNTSSLSTPTMPMLLNIINIEHDDHSSLPSLTTNIINNNNNQRYQQQSHLPSLSSSSSFNDHRTTTLASTSNPQANYVQNHETIQKKAFTKWLNSHLSKKGYPCIVDLFTDLRDGTILVALLDVLCGCKIRLERGNYRVHHINNVARALQVFSEKCQIKLVNISTNDIVDGNHKITLGLAWCIILHWQVNNILRNTGQFVNVINQQSSSSLCSLSSTTTTTNTPTNSSSSSSSYTNIPSFGGAVIGGNRLPTSINNSNSSSENVVGSGLSSAFKNQTSNQTKLNTKQTSNRFTSNVPFLTPTTSTTTTKLTNNEQSTPTATMSQNDLEKTLLAWCRKSTENYEGVHINNFTSSWNDGLAFNALIHHFRPKLFSYGEILSMDPEDRLRHAFDIAAKHLKIEKLLDPEDVNQPRPDKKSVMMYVMCFFQVLETAPTNSSKEDKKPTTTSSTTTQKRDRPSGLVAPTAIPASGSSDSSPGKRSRLTEMSPMKMQPITSSPQANKKLKSNLGPNSTQNRPSSIPVLSPDYQQQRSKFVQQQSKSPSVSSSSTTSTTATSSTIDSQLLNEYSSTIEDIMTWLLGAEDELKCKEQNDHQHFHETNFKSTTSSSGQTDQRSNITEMSPDFNQILHNRIMATIEAAEYAKERFAEHEQFMVELSAFSDKILKTFEKGKMLIESCAGQTRPGSKDSAGPGGSGLYDSSSKVEVAIHMNLLNQRFSELRSMAIKRQRYLQDMLIQAQNAQLDELRTLMTKTEQRISLLIPEKYDEIPYSFQSLQEQLKQFNELQETMNSEQKLLSAISKFVIVDQDDQNNKDNQANFVDQLEALNERWANVCKITENRGTFLTKLCQSWSAFDEEKNRLNDWFQRLERRLADVEESAEETLAKQILTKQDLKFLLDIRKRLERMRTDIFYGVDRSANLNLEKSSSANTAECSNPDETELELKAGSPISQITRLSHALIQLDSKGDSKLSQKVIQNIEDIGRRWETLAGQIESIENIVQERIKHVGDLEDVDTNITALPSSQIPKRAVMVTSASRIPELSMMKRRKVGLDPGPATTSTEKLSSFDVEWQQMEAFINWIDNNEKSLLMLSIAEDLFDFHSNNDDSTYKWIDFQIPDSFKKCLNVYNGLNGDLNNKQDQYQDDNKLQHDHNHHHHPVLIKLLKLDNKQGGNVSTLVGRPLPAALEYEERLLSQIEHEIHNKRSLDFEQLKITGEKIIEDIKAENENPESIENFMKKLIERWETFQKVINQLRLYLDMDSSLQVMKYEISQMLEALHKYRNKFQNLNEQLSDASNSKQQQAIDEHLIEQLNMCTMSIDGKMDKVKQYNSKLNSFFQQIPRLFIIWPDISSESEQRDLPWKHVDTESPTSSFAVAIENGQKIKLSSFQFRCFHLTGEILRFNQTVLIMQKMAELLRPQLMTNRGEWSMAKQLKTTATEKAMKISEIRQPLERQSSTVSESGSVKADKVRIAIDEFNTWLAKVIDMVDEYDDEDDEEDDEQQNAEQIAEEQTDNSMAHSLLHQQPPSTTTPSLEHPPLQKVKTNDSDNSHQRMPGSKLCSFSDLVNAIEHRIFILADLQKTVDDERQNYSFACKRAAEFIFEQNNVNDKSLTEIEQMLMDLKPDDYDEQTGQLISSIQSLMQRWGLLFEKLHTLLPQLEDISPSITVLETEFSQLLKFVESSDEFLDEPIAIGDNESLSGQLAECVRLKDYMQGTAEKNFQTIIDTAQKALKLLLGGKEDDLLFTYDVVPVIKYIKDTWYSLCERILNKLERLSYAQKMTVDLTTALDDYKTRLDDLEKEMQWQNMNKHFHTNNQTPLTNNADEMVETIKVFEKIVYNLPESRLKRLRQWKCNYENEISPLDVHKLQTMNNEDNGQNCLIMEMLQFISTNSNTLAFEQLKELATEKLPKRFEQLEQRLENNRKHFEQLIDSLKRIEESFDEERLFMEKMTKEYETLHNRKPHIQDVEDAAQLLDQVECCLAFCHDQQRQNRLKMVEQTLTNESMLHYFRNLPNIYELFEKYQMEFENMFHFETSFVPRLKQMIDVLEKFIVDGKEFDVHIGEIQKFLNENKQNADKLQMTPQGPLFQDPLLVQRRELEMRRNDLLSKECLYSSKFNALGFKSAIQRVESKSQFFMNLIDEALLANRAAMAARGSLGVPMSSSANTKHAGNQTQVNIAEDLAILERELADFGCLINEMEIPFDGQDEDGNELTIVQILTKMIKETCMDYETKLIVIKKRSDFVKRLIEKGTQTITPQQISRLEYLDETRNALNKALELRKEVLIDLRKHCSELTKMIRVLEKEAKNLIILPDNNAEQQRQLEQTLDADELQEQQRIKHNCRQTFTKICALKERLDIMCIRYSDVLIGIEDVCAYYDDFITVVAENYFPEETEDGAVVATTGGDDDQEEDAGASAAHQLGFDEQHIMITDDDSMTTTNQTTNITTSPTKQIDPIFIADSQPRIISQSKMEADEQQQHELICNDQQQQTSSIETEQPASMELSNKLTATTKLLLSSSSKRHEPPPIIMEVPEEKQSPEILLNDETLMNEEQITTKLKNNQVTVTTTTTATTNTTSIVSGDKIATVSPVQSRVVSIYKPMLLLSHDGLMKESNGLLLHPSTSYTFQSYLMTLKLLSVNMERIAQRQIPELVHRRQFNKENKMFPFMLEDELYILNKSLNGVRIHLEQILCASVLFAIKPSVLQSNLNKLSNHNCELHEQFDMAPESALQQYDQVKIFHPPNMTEDDGQRIMLNSLTDDWQQDDNQQQSLIDWDRCHCQVIHLLECLESKFQHSNGVFLTLHRHLKLIHEDTIQFNLEIRKLIDWYENVELQINNGRVTMVSADPNRLDEADLNLHVVARTQSLLVTQLKTHVPIYSRLRVIYEKILNHFSPELNEKFREYSFDFKALIEAKNKIKHEMKRVTRKWNSIVHELTWRRECLIDIAVCKPNATVNGAAYRPGIDHDFDALVRDAVRNELPTVINEYNGQYTMEQFQHWIEQTETEVANIRQQFVLRDDDQTAAKNLHKKLLTIEQDMARQFMNWMLITQEPFYRLLNVGQLMEADKDTLNNRFQKVTVTVYQLTYFVHVFNTTRSNIAQLIKNELEWLLLAHEHLHTIDDYLAQQSPLMPTMANISKMDFNYKINKLQAKTKSPDNAADNNAATLVQTFPSESMNFLDNIKNTLINHERTIKQISILFDELGHNSRQISLRYEMNELNKQFDEVKCLHVDLVERVRRHGLTVWSSMHYLLKNVYTYFHSYRQRKQQQFIQQRQTMKTTTTSSATSSPSTPPITGLIGSNHSLKQQQQLTNDTNQNQSWEYNRDELAGYYQLATIELNRWLTFETFMMALFIERSMQITKQHNPSNTNSTSNNNDIGSLPAPNILKYTSRRCQDFLTELNFAVLILEQIWLQLSLEQDLEKQKKHSQPQQQQTSIVVIDGKVSKNDVVNSSANATKSVAGVGGVVGGANGSKYLNRTQSNSNSIPAAIQQQQQPCFNSLDPRRRSKQVAQVDQVVIDSKTPTKATISELDIEFETESSSSSTTPQTSTICYRPDFKRYQTILEDIMERMRDLQREHHKRSLQHLLQLKQQMQQQQQLANNGQPAQPQQQPPPLPAPRQQQQLSSMSPMAMKRAVMMQQHQPQSAIDNVYDTVADAILVDGGNDVHNNHQQQQAHYYYRAPVDLPEIQNNSNLDMQRQDIEQWLDSMEQRLSRISVQQQKQHLNQQTNNSNGQSNRNHLIENNQINNNKQQSQLKTNCDQLNHGSLMDIHDLKSQLDILSEYEAECNQYSQRLQSLSNSIDARIASLAPLNQSGSSSSTTTATKSDAANTAAAGGVNNNSTTTSTNATNTQISMPYYDHLIKLRKQATDMQCRSNYLFLCIKCKTRSLNELYSLTSSSSNRNLIMSMVNGSVSGTDLDYYGSPSSSKKSSKTSPFMGAGASASMLMSGRTDSGSGSISGAPATSSTSTSSNTAYAAQSGQLTDSSVGGGVGSSNESPYIQANNYSLHEQSEKRFHKWLNEMEQSLDFIDKGLAAESALINNDDGSITNFNCNDGALYSNVSEMQQMHMNYYEKIKIIQREIEQKRADHRLLMELLENDASQTSMTGSSVDGTGKDQSSPYRRDQPSSKTSKDPWMNRFRSRVESLNDRWNSVRLRVLTLRSRLESSSFVPKNTTTTCPAIPPSHSASLYSVNSGYGATRELDMETASIVSMNAFQAVVSERASQLILSLRELTEWIIKRQMEFQQKQLIMQMPEEGQTRPNHYQPQNMPLDIANVLQQKSSLIQLRNQLIEKRPIIDSSVLACHNFLRRLDVKRAQDQHQAKMTAKLSASASMASSLAGSVLTDGTGCTGVTQLEQRFKQKQTELDKVEQTLNREMNKLLELWHSIQTTVDLGLQRVDEAHLRLTDLQRVMEELCLKLHEAEMVKSKWTPLANITFDELPQQRSQLKVYNQTYVAPVSRDVIHVNEIAARLTGRNVPLSHANLKSLEEVTTRARLLRVAVDERARELDQVLHDHGTAQQHFLTEAVEDPWERAVTQNKLPCYINRKTETVHYLSPKYSEIIHSMNQYNYVRYAAYRTAMKLRHLQVKLGLDQVTIENLMAAFEQHGLGPNASNNSQRGQQKINNKKSESNNNNNDSKDKKNDQKTTDQPQPQPQQHNTVNEELPYELRLIGVPDIVSCLKTIFERAEMEQREQLQQQQADAETSGGNKKKNKDKNQQHNKSNNEQQQKSSTLTNGSQPGTPNGSSSTSATNSTNTINVPLSVDLCLNWLLDLYDAPSRAGFIRQFSFQVALILLSRISLEQKYSFLFSLISEDNQNTDERHFGLLIYDCLRLPKLLGEVAAFGGTNVEPSVRSCIEMSGQPSPNGLITAEQVLTWIRAEPQSLVWLVVLHRLRLADRSRHPAKCNGCHLYPIVGFRYRCLKCFNFDLCQHCFLSDKSVKKHKPSHPMQEYCVATTSGEDMRDFTKILRNKFKSGRYFKRHQALGYLPVQSLHEGDRIEESAPSYVHTLQGSYSHAPSSNTTPVHTLSYHQQRAASPGSMTQRDLEFMTDSRFVASNTPHQRSLMMPPGLPTDGSVSPSPSMGIYGTRNIQQGRKFQTSIEHHLQQTSTGSPAMLPRAMSASRGAGVGPTSSNVSATTNMSRSSLLAAQQMLINKSTDDMHQRLGKYAHRLAEAESSMLNRSQSLRGSMHSASHHRSRSVTKFDSLPPEQYDQPIAPQFRRSSLGNPLSHQSHHEDIVQSPTEMLSKIAAHQRTELEVIIQRLQEENRLLMNEYSQLKSDKSGKNKTQVVVNANNEDSKSKPQSSLTNNVETNTNPSMKQQPKSSSTESSGSTSSTTNESFADSKKNNDNNNSSEQSSKPTTSSTSTPTSKSSSSRGSSVVAVVRKKQSMASGDESPGTPGAANAAAAGQSMTNGNISSPSQHSSSGSTGASQQSLRRMPGPSTSSDDPKSETMNCMDGEKPPEIPAYYWEEARRLRDTKNELESRKSELEKTNQLLESQLKQFKQYMNNSSLIDKQKLENHLQEAQRIMLSMNDDNASSPSGNKKVASTIMKFDDTEPEEGDDDESELDVIDSSMASSISRNSNQASQSTAPTNQRGKAPLPAPPSSSSSITYQQPLLHTAADRVNSAVERLVDAFSRDDPPESDETSQGSHNGSMINKPPTKPVQSAKITKKPNPTKNTTTVIHL